jgi:hypothetical protein
MCARLMREHQPDEFTFNFRKRTPIGHGIFTVIFPPGTDAYCSPIGFAESNGKYSITASRTEDDRVKISFAGDNVPPGQRVGMRIQLKN